MVKIKQMVKPLLNPLACRLVSLIFRQGAQLAPKQFIAEFRQGRYPMAGRLGHLTWHDPEMRGIIPLDERLHVPGHVQKLIRNKRFEITYDRAFREVITACATPTLRREFVWISSELMAAFIRIHKLGYAHSVEAWRDGKLVGGGFGIAIGGFYAGQSMFALEDNASKVAMTHLLLRLRDQGFLLRDSQVLSNLSRQFGAIEIPRAEFHTLLAQALAAKVSF